MHSPAAAAVPRHPVRIVASWTGLTPHVLRAWERRYGVVAPTRSGGGQRLYSDLDVERLQLLHRLTERGHPISRLARLSVGELGLLVLQEEKRADSDGAVPPVEAEESEDVRAALEAIERLDSTELQAILECAAVAIGVPAFLDEVAAPVIHKIGERWSTGRFAVAHEHLATAVLRRVLGWLLGKFTSNGAAAAAVYPPRILVATPQRQVHELGAMLAAATAAAEGCDVVYLGADLPVADIGAAARQTRAHAVALSVVHPSDDTRLPSDLARLRAELPEFVPLLVGGRGARVYGEQLAAPGIEIVDSLSALRTWLRTRLRAQAPNSLA